MAERAIPKDKLRVGAIYVVAGQGPMRLAKPLANSVQMTTLDGLNYWAGFEQLIWEVGEDYVKDYVQALKDRGIVPKDYEVSW